MNAWIRKAGLGIAVLALAAVTGRRAEAQGSTFGAVQGIVTQAGTTDRAIEGATITVTNTSNGQEHPIVDRHVLRHVPDVVQLQQMVVDDAFDQIESCPPKQHLSRESSPGVPSPASARATTTTAAVLTTFPPPG